MNPLSTEYYQTLPDQAQTLLLKACLSDNVEVSATAWNKWRSLNDYNQPVLFQSKRILPQVFDKLDFGSQRLLSLLYKKMTGIKIQDPLIDELKGYYRYVWVRNQILKNELEEIVKLFEANQIKHVIIKGFPKVEIFYKDWGARSVLDLDVVVHPQHWPKAIAVLYENKWTSKYQQIKPDWIKGSLHHAFTFIKNGNELDLHIRFNHFPLNKVTEEKFWSGTAFYRDGHRMLKPEHQIICSIAHGFQGKEEAIRAVTDIVYITKNVTISWEEIIEIAESNKLIIPARILIGYLQKENFINIPDVLTRLEVLPVSEFEYNYFKIIASPAPANGLKQFKLNLLHTAIITSSIKERFLLLLNNYRLQWGVKSVTGIFFAALWVGIHKTLYPNQKIEIRKIPFQS